MTSHPGDDVLAAVHDILASCDGHTTDSGFTARLASTSIPNLPQDAVAVRGTEESDRGGSLRLVVAAAGSDSGTVIVLGVVPLGQIDETLVGHAVATMVDRLE